MAGGDMADPRLVEALERLVVGAVGLTTVALAEFAPAAELTLPQWRALLVVARADGVRVTEIGTRVGMALPSASRLVRRLERRGLVTTARDETDRRGIIVRPTAAGLELWRDLVDYRRRLIADLLDTLPAPLPAGLADDLERVERAFARYA
jgi:DNA-binding MarR family transcriptional regulator